MISIPFAWTHEAVEEITLDSQDWIGSVAKGWEWYYADYMLLLTFGGIPWQVLLLYIFFVYCRGGVLTPILATDNC